MPQQYNMPSLGPRYHAIGLLGSGCFGTVVKAYDRQTNEEVAIKILNPASYGSKYVEDELIHHSRLAEHPHIIQFREVFLHNGQLCLAMEFADGGTLLHYVNSRRRLDEGLARWFFQQLIFAVTYCHKLRIAVRDIKLENILLARCDPPDPYHPERCWLVKLCDFGFSKSSEPLPVMRSRVGTPAYMAPEVIKAGSRSDYNGMMADIWSCGVVLFTMLFGAFPFNYKHQHGDSSEYLCQLLQHMMKQELCPPQHVAVPDECYRFLLGLLNPNPHQRLTLQRIYNHPWFQVGLPATVLEYYDNPETIGQDPIQDPDQIRAMLQQAKHLMLQRTMAQAQAQQAHAQAQAQAQAHPGHMHH